MPSSWGARNAHGCVSSTAGGSSSVPSSRTSMLGIPRGQRFSLSRLAPAERLEKLRGRLAAFRYTVEIGSKDTRLPPETLAGYFDLNLFPRDGLPDVLRRIIDLDQHLGDEYQVPTI